MIKKKIVAPSKRYKKAESEDLTLRINFEEDKSLLREGDKNIVLSPSLNKLLSSKKFILKEIGRAHV